MARVPFVERRVEQAPVGVELSRVRATGQDFGSTVGESVTQLGRQMGDVVAKYQAEKDNKASMEAFNAFTEEAGKAQIGFRSLKANAVNDEVKTKYVEDIDKIRNKYRGQLNGRALEQFNSAADRAVVAKRLDAESHTVNETRVATEMARQTLIATSRNEAVAFEGGFSGNDALLRGREAIALQPGVDADTIKAMQSEFAGSIASEVVTRHLQSGDIDGATRRVEEVKASGLLDPKTVVDLDAQLGRATQHREDTRKAAQFIESGFFNAEADFLEGKAARAPGERPEDVDEMQIQAQLALDAQVSEGKVTPEEAERIRPLIDAQTSRVKRERTVRDRANMNAAAETVQGSASHGASMSFIKGLKDEDQWMAPGLMALNEKMHGDTEANRKKDALVDALAPDQSFKAKTSIMRAISLSLDAREEKSAAAWATEAAQRGLTKADIEEVREFAANGGVVNGLTPARVLDAIRDPAKNKAYKDDPEKLYALFLQTARRWDPTEEVSAITLDKQVGTLVWEGATADGAQMSYLDAAAADRTHEWRPKVTPEQLAEIKQDMFAKADRIRAKGEALIAAGEEEEGRALISEAYDLKYPAIEDPNAIINAARGRVGPFVSPTDPGARAAETPELRRLRLIEEGSIRALPLEQARAIRAEQFLLSERFHADTRADPQLGDLEKAAPGMLAEQRRDMRRAGLVIADAQNQQARADQYAADVNIRTMVSQLKGPNGAIGIQAAEILLEQSIEKGELPKWINAYRTKVNPSAEPLPFSTREDRIKAREEAYAILARARDD